MYELFIQEFNKKVPLTRAEQGVIEEHLILKKLRKKQMKRSKATSTSRSKRTRHPGYGQRLLYILHL